MAKSNQVIVAMVCSLFVSLGFARSAQAEDKWTETVSFTRSDTSAIKVFEPDGYTASVTVDGQPQSDAVPTVLRVPNSDAFYVVTITAPSGAKWSKKIETKKSFVTELRVKHTASAAGGGGPAKKKFFGKFAMSVEQPCKADGSSTKIEFVDGDGAAAASFVMKGDKSFTGQVPEGDYQVRTFRVETDGTEVYRNTRHASIRADGWKAILYCAPNGNGVDINVLAK